MEDFIWRGKHLATLGDISDMVITITREKNDEEAAMFMDEYRRINPYADENVGYLSGYFGPHEMIEIMLCFDVNHPIFGNPQTANEITPEAAFELGKRLGNKHKLQIESQKSTSSIFDKLR